MVSERTWLFLLTISLSEALQTRLGKIQYAEATAKISTFRYLNDISLYPDHCGVHKGSRSCLILDCPITFGKDSNRATMGGSLA